MDSGVVSSIGRTGFARRAGHPGQVERDQVRICRAGRFGHQHGGPRGATARGQRKRARRPGYCAHYGWNRPALQGTRSILDGIPLPAAQGPRICSEADVKHGREGSKQRSGAGFLSTLGARLGHHPRSDRVPGLSIPPRPGTRRHRWSHPAPRGRAPQGSSAGRASGPGMRRPACWPAPAHLQ